LFLMAENSVKQKSLYAKPVQSTLYVLLGEHNNENF
jgi:hypothetical protein